MTALALAGLLVAFPEAVPDSVDAPCAGGAVVTRADLQAAGATHVHDALRLAGVDGVTVDGFDVMPVAAVGVPFAESVRVFLDGAPVGRGASIEPRGVEALPIALAEIERVVVCPGPGVAGGAFGGPWIDVHTAPPTRYAYAAASYGNEAGDPGPARYLDPTLPNVDRLGPDVEGGLGVAYNDREGVWWTARHRDFLPTDPAVLPRTLAASVSERYPKRIGYVASGSAAGQGLRLRVAFREFADLPFVPEAESEVPLQHGSVQTTASNTWRWGWARVKGHLHAGFDSLSRPPWSALALDPDWYESRLDAALSAEQERGGRRLGGGARVEAVMVDSPGFLTHQRSAGHASVWTRFGRTAGATDLDATASGSVASSGFGGGLAAVAAWRATPRVQIALAASARRKLPEVDPDLAFWAARGYTAFPDAVPEAEPVDVARFRLGATSRVGAVRLGASAEVQGARAHVVHRGALAEAEGTATVARTEAAWARPGLRLRASATVRGALSGTEAFRSMWRRLPRLGAALDATLRPDDRLALWARLAARSGSRWDGFSGPELPAAVLLDLGLSKRAWGDRLCFSLAGRNVLGAEERTHPLGADLAPRLFVRLEARL